MTKKLHPEIKELRAQLREEKRKLWRIVDIYENKLDIANGYKPQRRRHRR